LNFSGDKQLVFHLLLFDRLLEQAGILQRNDGEMSKRAEEFVVTLFVWLPAQAFSQHHQTFVLTLDAHRHDEAHLQLGQDLTCSLDVRSVEPFDRCGSFECQQCFEQLCLRHGPFDTRSCNAHITIVPEADDVAIHAHLTEEREDEQANEFIGDPAVCRILC